MCPRRTRNGLLKTPSQGPLGERKSVARRELSLTKHSLCFKPQAIMWCHVPRAQNTRVRASGEWGRAGGAAFTITPNNTLPEFLLSVPGILSSTDLERVVPKGGVLSPEATHVSPLNWRLSVPPGHLGLPVPLNNLA